MVVEYPREWGQVVHSVTPSIVHSMKVQLGGVWVLEWRCGPDPILGPYPSNEKASFSHQLENPPTLR